MNSATFLASLHPAARARSSGEPSSAICVSTSAIWAGDNIASAAAAAVTNPAATTMMPPNHRPQLFFTTASRLVPSRILRGKT
jgi:hypothetical protein